MFYSIRHLTKFHYKKPISESVMETRMQPRNDSNQSCVSFTLSVSPRCRVFSYRDHLGNNVQHFDIPGDLDQLVIIGESLMELRPWAGIPQALGPEAWQDLDAMVAAGDFWEALLPSEFARPTPHLLDLADKLEVRRRGDPLSLLRELNRTIYEYFDYVPHSTRVDSPIDEAIVSRRGVCQDFAHTMIALVRFLKIPCRYVSGYLYHGSEAADRSTENATHAWVEAFLPSLGWVSFDPTNNLLALDRHVRTAVGRDYADVPPTRGLFRGSKESEMSVAVKVSAFEQPPELDRDLPIPEDWSMLVQRTQQQPVRPENLLESMQMQQQQ